MVLNYIWIAFFLIAFVVALCNLVIGGDTVVFFCFGKDRVRDIPRTDGSLGSLARHHENRGKRGRDTGLCPVDGTRVQQALSRNTERPSGNRFYLHVQFRQPVRLGQCRHADGTESHERVAGAEHAEGFRQRSDDHVPLHQRFGTDADPGLHHDLPGTDGSGKPG